MFLKGPKKVIPFFRGPIWAPQGGVPLGSQGGCHGGPRVGAIRIPRWVPWGPKVGPGDPRALGAALAALVDPWEVPWEPMGPNGGNKGRDGDPPPKEEPQ